MEVVITQENLDFALSNVSRLATSRAGLPILNNILLRTDGTHLLLAATNLEIAASHKVNAKIIKQGSITIPAKLITEFVHNLPKEQITLKVSGSKITITSGKLSATINGTNDDEFPELPVVSLDDAVSYSLSVSDFKDAISQTIIAASSDSTRPILTGVLWYSFDGDLYTAATDGYRLAERKILPTKSDFRVVIPTSTLQEVMRSLKEDVSEIEVFIDETQVTFKFLDIDITSRLIDGNFPDYRQLIPQSTDSEFTIKKSEFNRAVKVAGLFARESGGGITIAFDSDSNIVTIQSIASEIGENSTEVSVIGRGVTGSVSLNSKYVIDALSVLSADTITFGFSGKLAPCILSDDRPDSVYKHIVMPLKS